MKLILLGTGTPGLNLIKPRAGSSTALVLGEDVLLFDCGRWITFRLAQSGINPNQVTHFFFTHIFHFDHTCNYYDFLMSVRPGRLNIYGPPGTKEYTEKLLNLHGTYGESRVRPILDWVKNHTTDVEKDTICSGDNWKVIAADVDVDTNWRSTIVYRVECGNESIVMAWDIHPRMDLHENRQPWEFDDTYTSRPKLMELMEGADILIADAMSIHTTPEGVGIAAEKAKVKKIVLTHLTDPSGPPRPPRQGAIDGPPRPPRQGAIDGPPRPPRQRAIDLAILKERVKNVFSGEVILGEDLMEI